jgi:hypothetical protein
MTGKYPWALVYIFLFSSIENTLESHFSSSKTDEIQLPDCPPAGSPLFPSHQSPLEWKSCDDACSFTWLNDVSKHISALSPELRQKLARSCGFCPHRRCQLEDAGRMSSQGSCPIGLCYTKLEKGSPSFGACCFNNEAFNSGGVIGFVNKSQPDAKPIYKRGRVVLGSGESNSDAPGAFINANEVSPGLIATQCPLGRATSSDGPNSINEAKRMIIERNITLWIQLAPSAGGEQTTANTNAAHESAAEEAGLSGSKAQEGAQRTRGLFAGWFPSVRPVVDEAGARPSHCSVFPLDFFNASAPVASALGTPRRSQAYSAGVSDLHVSWMGSSSLSREDDYDATPGHRHRNSHSQNQRDRVVPAGVRYNEEFRYNEEVPRDFGEDPAAQRKLAYLNISYVLTAFRYSLPGVSSPGRPDDSKATNDQTGASSGASGTVAKGSTFLCFERFCPELTRRLERVGSSNTLNSDDDGEGNGNGGSSDPGIEYESTAPLMEPPFEIVRVPVTHLWYGRWQDFQVPPVQHRKALSALAATAARRLAAGGTVATSCFSGRGRSGTFAALVLGMLHDVHSHEQVFVFCFGVYANALPSVRACFNCSTMN